MIKRFEPYKLPQCILNDEVLIENIIFYEGIISTLNVNNLNYIDELSMISDLKYSTAINLSGKVIKHEHLEFTYKQHISGCIDIILSFFNIHNTSCNISIITALLKSIKYLSYRRSLLREHLPKYVESDNINNITFDDIQVKTFNVYFESTKLVYVRLIQNMITDLFMTPNNMIYSGWYNIMIWYLNTS